MKNEKKKNICKCKRQNGRKVDFHATERIRIRRPFSITPILIVETNRDRRLSKFHFDPSFEISVAKLAINFPLGQMDDYFIK